MRTCRIRHTIQAALVITVAIGLHLNCTKDAREPFYEIKTGQSSVSDDDSLDDNDDNNPGTTPLLDSEELAARLEKARSSSVTKSISAAVITGDGAVYTAVANQDGDLNAVTSDMLFGIASCTKMFTAACAFRLIEEGLFGLDNTLQDLLYDTGVLDDDFKTCINPRIRVRDLLNHTTGLDDYLGYYYYYGIWLDVALMWNPLMTLSYVEEPFYEYDADNPENNEFNYSNTDYILLGMIIENIAGNEIYNLMRSYFLDPLKLVNTFMVGIGQYPGLTSLPGILAIGFEPTADDDSWEKAWIMSSYYIGLAATALYSSTWTSGNMVSDSADMARWVRYFYRYQEALGYLTDEAFNTAAESSDFFTERKFGYGIEYVKHESGTELYGHTGTIMGYSSMVFYMPEKDVSIALLINDHYIWRWGILHVVVDYVINTLE